MAQDPQIQDQTGPGWDSPGPAGTTLGAVSKNGGFVDDVKLYWRQIMDTSVLAPVQGLFNSADETGQQIVKNELDHAHPVRAALAKGYFEAQKDVTDLLSGLTTPTNIALGIVSGGESVAAKAVATVSGLYFGWRGSQQMLEGRQAGETQAEEIRRRAFGALQTVAGGAGAVTGGVSAKEALRSSIQNNLGLSGELAAKVQAKIEQAEEIRAAAIAKQRTIETAISGASTKVAGMAAIKAGAIDAAAQTLIDSTQPAYEAKIQEIQNAAKSQAESAQKVSDTVAAATAAQTPIELNKIMAQASQTVAMENARLQSEYRKMNENATAPVTTAEDLKAEIVNSIKARGVQDAEITKIENKIFAALPKAPSTTVRAPTSAENTASQVATSFSRAGMNVESIRSALVNQGYVPVQVDTAMAMAFPHLKPSDNANVSFEMSRRVKNDLWSAAQSATDMELRNGLYDALANVDGIRQRYAEAHGFGPQHSKLNSEYMKFKRELGSGTMDEFLKANDFADQNSILLTAKNLINQDSGEALRGLLDLAGVDTTPLKAALDEHKAFAPLPEQALPEIIKQAEAQSKAVGMERNQFVSETQKQAAAATKQIESGKQAILTSLANKKESAISDLRTQMDAGVAQVGETNPIIPGKSDLALAGKGNLQIRLDAMRAIADNAKKSGITNAGAYIQILWGTARLLSGSPFGGFSAASGGTRLALEKMLRSKGFQDYVAQESGVTAEAMPKFRRTLAKSYPYLEKIALSTVAAGGLNQANQKKSQPLVMPPPAPAKTSGNITIAGSQ